jgi:hypothetical protein
MGESLYEAAVLGLNEIDSGSPVNFAHVPARFSDFFSDAAPRARQPLDLMPESKRRRGRCAAVLGELRALRWELEWLLADARERPVDIAEEPVVKPGSFVLVPSRGILEIGLGDYRLIRFSASSKSAITWSKSSTVGRPRSRTVRRILTSL